MVAEGRALERLFLEAVRHVNVEALLQLLVAGANRVPEVLGARALRNDLLVASFVHDLGAFCTLGR